MTKCVLMPLLIILLLSGAAYAVKADDAAIRILNNQLQLLALLPEGQEFADDLRSMSRGDLNLQLELREGIEQDIAAFWKRRGVPLAFNTLPLDANSLSRALALEPQEDDYLATSSRIRYLIWLAERHQWPRLDPGGWLRPGDSHLLIPTIAKRLYWLGDLSSEPGDNKVYSPQLASAVEAFQSRHGLKTDAIIGPDTLRWLNTEPLQRARMLAGNFVARTVYKQQLGKRYLLVNIPAFELTLVDDNQVQLRSRVIVGKPYRQTPLLSSEVSNIVLNPTWTVPRGILRRDLLPQIRKDGEYLQQRHFNVYDYQGNRVEESAEAWQKEASGRFPIVWYNNRAPIMPWDATSSISAMALMFICMTHRTSICLPKPIEPCLPVVSGSTRWKSWRPGWPIIWCGTREPGSGCKVTIKPPNGLPLNSACLFTWFIGLRGWMSGKERNFAATFIN